MNFLKQKLKSAIHFYKKFGLISLLKHKVLGRVIKKYWDKRYDFHPRVLFTNFNKVTINKPIFFLGIQTGGITIINRVVKRHPFCVSIGGNNSFWAGRDELDKAVKDIPDEFALRSPGYNNMIESEKNHPIFGFDRGGLYATDELIDEYRKTENDFSKNISQKFKNSIKRALVAYSEEFNKARFVDQSQSFSVKVPLITKILKNSNPKFVLVLRNPYAACWGNVVRQSRNTWNKIPTDKEKLQYAVEHWENTFRIALNDLSNYGDFHILRTEDFIKNPKKEAKKVFEYCDLEFKDNFLPHPDHILPIGSIQRQKWYPIKKDVNKKYLNELPDWAKNIIYNRCKNLAERFNYTPKGP